MWLKANLHMHTTASDGALAPAEALSWYAARDYGLVAITDHLTVTRLTPPPGLIVIPGCELHYCHPQESWEYHVVVLGELVDEVLARYTYVQWPQVVFDEAQAAGCVAFMAHPYRMGLTRTELRPLRHALGIEIWNSTSNRYGKALSTQVWDDLLASGWRGWGLANDDVHWRDGEAGQGWMMVNVAEPSVAGAIAALAAGQFYSSRGPAIEAISLAGREIEVSCSPCVSVRFIGDRWHCASVQALDGGSLTRARATLPPGTPYARVECVDATGRVAWSNPLWFD